MSTYDRTKLHAFDADLFKANKLMGDMINVLECKLRGDRHFEEGISDLMNLIEEEDNVKKKWLRCLDLIENVFGIEFRDMFETLSYECLYDKYGASNEK